MATDRNEELRARFRYIYAEEVPFNGLLGLRITRWEPDGVRMEIPFRADLTAHASTFHGGVVATLIDCAASGAVLAGHDFANGSRVSTVSLTINYLSIAADEGLVAEAVCTRRGKSLNYAHVIVRSAESGKAVAEGIAALNMASRSRPAGDGTG